MKLLWHDIFLKVNCFCKSNRAQITEVNFLLLCVRLLTPRCQVYDAAVASRR